MYSLRQYLKKHNIKKIVTTSMIQPECLSWTTEHRLAVKTACHFCTAKSLVNAGRMSVVLAAAFASCRDRQTATVWRRQRGTTTYGNRPECLTGKWCSGNGRRHCHDDEWRHTATMMAMVTWTMLLQLKLDIDNAVDSNVRCGIDHSRPPARSFNAASANHHLCRGLLGYGTMTLSSLSNRAIKRHKPTRPIGVRMTPPPGL